MGSWSDKPKSITPDWQTLWEEFVSTWSKSVYEMNLSVHDQKVLLKRYEKNLSVHDQKVCSIPGLKENLKG